MCFYLKPVVWNLRLNEVQLIPHLSRLVCDISHNYCLAYFFQQNLNSTKLPEKGIKVFAALLHTHLQGLCKIFIANSIIVFLILINERLKAIPSDALARECTPIGMSCEIK